MSEILESISWVLHLKSHLLSLSSLQETAIRWDAVFLAGYLALIVGKATAARLKIVAAFLVCVVVGYSPLYDVLNNVQYYSLLSLIYLTAAKYVSNKKIKYTLVIMTAFEFTMAMDRYVNAGTATWLYDNFEIITCLIHFLIISSSLKLRPIEWRELMGRLIAAMRGLSHSYCLTSRL